MKKAFPILIVLFIILVSVFYINKYFREDNLDTTGLKEAMYYESLDNGTVRCNLCPNRCVLREGQRGLCKVREMRGGKLYSLNYGKIVSYHIDPVEKKPIFHLLPGSKSFSIATAGCNFRCLNCQNWEISQRAPEELESEEMTPEQIVEKAVALESRSIAYTYSEPVIFYELMLETAKLAHQKGLYNIMVTNGYINPEPLRELCQYIDAFNVDLKGFSEEFYQKIPGGSLAPVLETLKIIQKEGRLLEITYLIIPGENDSEEEIRKAVAWVRDNIGETAILHFSRFYPAYKLENLPPTPEKTIIRAWEIAREEGLKYVYTGNISDPKSETTYCGDEPAIRRQGYFVLENKLEEGKCPNTEEVVPGIWK